MKCPFSFSSSKMFATTCIIKYGFTYDFFFLDVHGPELMNCEYWRWHVYEGKNWSILSKIFIKETSICSWSQGILDGSGVNCGRVCQFMAGPHTHQPHWPMKHILDCRRKLECPENIKIPHGKYSVGIWTFFLWSESANHCSPVSPKKRKHSMEQMWPQKINVH